ncbi:MAG: hypothetical protein LBJ69_02645 [Holosporales bacterium]|jgi:hypothetical protein|nr:hypothetical protein [Holosporales bacterium]
MRNFKCILSLVTCVLATVTLAASTTKASDREFAGIPVPESKVADVKEAIAPVINRLNRLVADTRSIAVRLGDACQRAASLDDDFSTSVGRIPAWFDYLGGTHEAQAQQLGDLAPHAESSPPPEHYDNTSIAAPAVSTLALRLSPSEKDTLLSDIETAVKSVYAVTKQYRLIVALSDAAAGSLATMARQPGAQRGIETHGTYEAIMAVLGQLSALQAEAAHRVSLAESEETQATQKAASLRSRATKSAAPVKKRTPRTKSLRQPAHPEIDPLLTRSLAVPTTREPGPEDYDLFMCSLTEGMYDPQRVADFRASCAQCATQLGLRNDQILQLRNKFITIAAVAEVSTRNATDTDKQRIRAALATRHESEPMTLVEYIVTQLNTLHSLIATHQVIMMHPAALTGQKYAKVEGIAADEGGVPPINTDF